MPEKTDYSPGTPVWVDVCGPDGAALKAFYNAVFGWESVTEPNPDFGGYSTFQINGKNIGGVMEMADQPPGWTCYIATEDADKTVEVAQGAGATLFAPPMDVADHGRMAVLADPTGAAFGIWQANQMKGTELEDEPGTVCWIELNTRDVPKAIEFYETMGWPSQTSEMPGAGSYTEFKLGDRSVAGMMAMPEQVPAAVPAHWMPYFVSADVDDTAQRVTGAGGQAIVEPRNIPPGRFAVFSDPQGAVFAVLKPSEG